MSNIKSFKLLYVPHYIYKLAYKVVILKYFTEHSERPLYTQTLINQSLSIKITKLRLDFLEKCRNNNILPISTSSRKVLLEDIKCIKTKLSNDNALLLRNFHEENISSIYQCAFKNIVHTKYKTVLKAKAISLNTRYHQLVQDKANARIFPYINYTYPIYNFTSHNLPTDIAKFMHKYEPKSNILGFKPSELAIMSEVDSLAAEIEDLYHENGTNILEEQRKNGVNCVNIHTISHLFLSTNFMINNTHTSALCLKRCQNSVLTTNV